MSFLLRNLIHFGRLLHALGLDVHAGRMLEVANALAYIDIGRRADFYHTLQSLLVHRKQDLAAFDEAFRMFWRPPPGEWSTRDLRALGETRRIGAPQIDVPPDESRAVDGSAGPALERPLERIAAMSYSEREISRARDFAELTDEELREAEAAIAALTWRPGTRRTRRWRSGRGRSFDLRSIVRRNTRFGGEPIVLPRRERTVKRRPLVLLCDVSGSMERYARVLVRFVHSMAGAIDRIEVFVFSTRLTRITRELTGRRAAQGIETIPRRVQDWGGGTRIGEALRAFNVHWANRVLSHGAVVLLISDGWDRGDPVFLGREMARLQRSCRRLIWLNPLLGSAGYRPLTRGMQAALPFVDDFLPVHNLASLEKLAEHLNALPVRRTRTRRATIPPCI